MDTIALSDGIRKVCCPDGYGGVAARELSLHMHFYMAALLTLSDEELSRIVDCMRAHGAEVELGPLPSGPTPKPTD